MILNLVSQLVVADDFILRVKDQQVKIAFQKSDGLLINDICLANLKNCQAFQEAHSKVEVQKKIKGNLGSPAQNFCKSINGTALTLFKPDQTTMSFCSFDDQTIISSWDLYNQRKSIIKSIIKIKKIIYYLFI